MLCEIAHTPGENPLQEGSVRCVAGVRCARAAVHRIVSVLVKCIFQRGFALQLEAMEFEEIYVGVASILELASDRTSRANLRGRWRPPVQHTAKHTSEIFV